MIKRCPMLLAALLITALSARMATAQEVAKTVSPDAQSPTTSVLILLLPLVFLGLLVVLMRRSQRVQPLMDRSLQIAEETLQLTREQIALQKETNRLLGQLIAARDGDNAHRKPDARPA